MAPKIGATEAPMSVETSPDASYEDQLGLSPVANSLGEEKRYRPKKVIVWRNVVLFALLHIGAVYALTLTWKAKILTLIWGVFCYHFSALGITAGAHRLWAHRAYKARLPLRILLALMNSCAFQNDIIEWSRDHRVHHKYSETDADPHNATRGFFFSHVGWLLVRKHPDVKEKGKQLDLSDLYADPILRFQQRYYKSTVVLICFLIPSIVPVYFWGETLWNAYFLCAVLRYCLGLNATWMVNSAAHIWGSRPYDKNINPRQNIFVSISAVGEGFHNYHHVFPQDYSTSEWGMFFNFSTFFIDAMAAVGLAYDRKKIPRELVQKRKERTGEKSCYTD